MCQWRAQLLRKDGRDEQFWVLEDDADAVEVRVKLEPASASVELAKDGQAERGSVGLVDGHS